VTLTTTHAYSEPGTYFATALVASRRDGDVDAKPPATAERRVGAGSHPLAGAWCAAA
jgi:hypothetical protein